MAEPTLKDLLAAIAELQSEVRSELRSELSKIRSEMATKTELAKLDAKVDRLTADVSLHRRETKKGFEDLDKELSGHADRSTRTSRRTSAS